MAPARDRRAPSWCGSPRGSPSARRQHCHLRLPVHGGGAQSPGQGAGARSGVAGRRRGADRCSRPAALHRRQVDGRTDRLARRGAGRPGRWPGSSSSATRCIRPAAREAARRAPAGDPRTDAVRAGQRATRSARPTRSARCCPAAPRDAARDRGRRSLVQGFRRSARQDQVLSASWTVVAAWARRNAARST